MKTAISIIVPIYKVEKYLQRCINSVLLQDFTNWEMILIDDGSPDDSPKICDENAKKDSRIKVLHKNNEGVSIARQSGISLAKSDHVLFLDSDDYLLPYALTKLYQKAIEGNYDIVKGCNRRVTDKNTFEIERPEICDTEIVGSENYLKALIYHKIKPYLWGGLYKRELFENCKNIFPKIPISEDWITNMAIWKKVNKYIVISDVVFAYFMNPSSVMQNKVQSHQYIDKIASLMHTITTNSTNDITHIVDLNRTAAHIRTFFVPEISWNKNEYTKIKAFLTKGKNLEEIVSFLDNHYLKYIKNEQLFFIYSRTYAILFKLIKLKGYTRKIS